jgi:ABC-2 type transport system permease protein/oleandomycin transport system permease protein
LLVATYAFSANAQSAQAATLIVVPLTFVSSAYVPNQSLPGWMPPVANHSPVTVLSNAVRSLMLGGTDAAGIGHTTGYRVALSLVWCAGITIVSARSPSHALAAAAEHRAPLTSAALDASGSA